MPRCRDRRELAERAHHVLDREFGRDPDVHEVAVGGDERAILTGTDRVVRKRGRGGLFERADAVLEPRPELAIQLDRVLLRDADDLAHGVRPERLQPGRHRLGPRLALDAAEHGLHAGLSFLNLLEPAQQEDRNEHHDRALKHAIAEPKRIAERLVRGIHRLPHGGFGTCGRGHFEARARLAARGFGGLGLVVGRELSGLFAHGSLRCGFTSSRAHVRPAAGCPWHRPARRGRSGGTARAWCR
jgi:hypothetical protein